VNKSTTKQKPSKPYPDFPLFPHATKRWAKKIRGKTHYFGAWDDPDAALAKYQEQAADLHAGRTPREDVHGITVADVCNRFLTSKKHLRDSGEIVERTFRDYYSACEKVVTAFSKDRIA